MPTKYVTVVWFEAQDAKSVEAAIELAAANAGATNIEVDTDEAYTPEKMLE